LQYNIQRPSSDDGVLPSLTTKSEGSAKRKISISLAYMQHREKNKKARITTSGKFHPEDRHASHFIIALTQCITATELGVSNQRVAMAV